MAPNEERVKQSDVTFWALVAMVCGAVAVTSANISALVPDDVLVRLHSSRIEGGSVVQLRQQVAQLRTGADALASRQSVIDRQVGDAMTLQSGMAQRVGALEQIVPGLIEARANMGPPVDNSITTAGIGSGGATRYEVEGGSVRVQQKPLSLSATMAREPQPPLLGAATPAAAPDAKLYGLAVGPAVTTATASGTWQMVSMKLGALIMGLNPLLSDGPADAEKRIVIGPLRALAEAGDMCARMEKMSVSCQPVPFVGKPL